MGHKVAFKKVEWSELENEVQKKPQGSKRNLVYVIGCAFVLVLLLGVALGIRVSPTPVSAPNTVINWDGLEIYKVNGIRYAKDGTTGAIQDAIDDLPTNGGLVMVPNGTFSWTTAFTVASNNFALTGSGATTIKVTGEVGAFILAGNKNITIANIDIDGNKPKATTQIVFSVQSSFNITFSAINIRSWEGYGWGIGGSHGVRVLNCHTSDWSTTTNPESLWLANCTDAVIEGNSFASAISTQGIDGYSIKIANNNLTGGATSHGGIYVWRQTHHVTIEGNYISGFQHSAIECRASNITIIGNHFTANSAGIEVFSYALDEQVRDVVISANIIVSNTNQGIYVYQDGANSIPSRISIQGNAISSNGGVGIKTDADAGMVSIVGNIISGNAGSEGVYCLSPYALISNNQITASTYVGVHIGGNNMTVTGNLIRNGTVTGGYGILVDAFSRDFQVTNNQLSDRWGNGVGINLVYSDSFNFLISDNVVSDFRGANSMGISASGARHGVISDNIIHNIEGIAGIQLLGACSAISVNGNSVSENYRRGIYLNGVTNITIQSNVATSNSRLGANTYSGIAVADTNNCTFVGNVAYNDASMPYQKYGLETTGTCDYLIIIANIFTPNVSGNYSVTCSSSYVLYANW